MSCTCCCTTVCTPACRHTRSLCPRCTPPASRANADEHDHPMESHHVLRADRLWWSTCYTGRRRSGCRCSTSCAASVVQCARLGQRGLSAKAAEPRTWRVPSTGYGLRPYSLVLMIIVWQRLSTASPCIVPLVVLRGHAGGSACGGGRAIGDPRLRQRRLQARWDTTWVRY